MFTLTLERFNERTLANMEVALTRACESLPEGSDGHEARRYIASRIIECAEGGDPSLGGLTKAGHAAALELLSHRAA